MTDGTYRPPSNVASVDGQFRSLSSAPLILLVDDNPHIAASLAVAMRLAGLELHWAAEPEGALSRIAVHCYEAILLDLNYTAGRADGVEGLALLQRILEEDPSARVLVITAHSGVRIAVEAMRAGACDFVMKPWRNAELLAKLERARTTQGFAAMQPATRHLAEPSRLIGESAAMSHVRDLIRRVGPTMAGVLVTGLPGSGRTLVAAAIHAASARASRKLVRVDLRDEEAWSRLDQAEETLLLAHSDRLSELEQLRLLERLPTEARILATADRADGVHPALARRVAAVEVAVPPLALRGDDVLLLARHFARVAAERHGRPPPRLTPAAEAALVSVDWPDQVRGLAAAIERAVLLGDGGVIDAALLGQPAAAPAPVTVVPSSRFDLERNERAVIEAALREHHHNVTHAASALGLSRGALYRRMERYGL